MKDASQYCVSVRNVSKKFARSLKRSFIYGARDIGGAMFGLTPSAELRQSEFWAIRDVSFDLAPGKSIGIVGLNGSGKTTLLRMVSGIISPTAGSIAIRGRVAPMLALGAGFKPVLSGRENIFLNMSILGMPQQEIVRRLDSVIDFAEMWDSIDAPLGTYSSGMLARLGFACAIHTNPSILVVDEVLSVGDAKFRAKCRNYLNQLRKQGTSMLLVSHSAALVEALSDECIYLKAGIVASQGAPAEVLKLYEADAVTNVVENNKRVADRLASQGRMSSSQEIRIKHVGLGLADTKEANYWISGDHGYITITLDASVSSDEISVNLMIFDLAHDHGEMVLHMKTAKDIGWVRVNTGLSRFVLEFSPVGLRPGTYRLKVSVSRGEWRDTLDVVDNFRLVVRDGGLTSNALYYQPRNWVLADAFITQLPDIHIESIALEDGFE
jgi:lipopolysaccharide transport system ATP-binding protein